MPAAADTKQTQRDYDADPLHAYGLITPRFWHGMLPGDFLRSLARNRFQVGPRGVFTSTTITLVGCCHLVGKLFQQAIYGRRLTKLELREPPLFVLGHWRSGTTLLHELLIRDPRHTFPTTYDCFSPHHCLVTESWLPRLIPWLLPKKRPMDNVATGWDRPQEDEFALCSLGMRSPYRVWMFPQHGPVDSDWLTLEGLSESDRTRWIGVLRSFVRTITARRQGRVVLKSPPHTARVETLLRAFPDARFVHITRDPLVLFPSTVRLWRSLAVTQGLQRPREHYDWIEEEVLTNLVKMYDAFERDRPQIPDGRLTEMRYEDLIEDPKRELRRVYDELDLGAFSEIEPGVDAYLADQKGYKTNRFELPDDVREMVADRWKGYAQRYGYA